MRILKFIIYNNLIQKIGLMMNNRTYTEKIYDNISIIYLIETQKIEEFNIKIIKTIINLT